MTSGDIVAHACLIHCSSKVLGGGQGFPRQVLSIGPLNIHSSNSSASFALNGRFQDTSAGCNLLVHPPGITAMSELCLVFTASLTLGVMCARNASQTSRRRRRFFTPYSFPSQNMMLSSFTHDFLPEPHMIIWTPTGISSFFLRRTDTRQMNQWS